MGSVLRKLGRLKLAIKCYGKALSVRRRFWPGINLELRNNFGLLLEELGAYEVASQFYHFMLIPTLRGTEGGPLHNPRMARVFNHLGRALQVLGRFKKALDYHGRAHKILEAVYGSIHPDLSDTLHYLGDCLRALGRFEESRTWLEKALKMNRFIHGDKAHPEVAAILNSLSQTLKEQGEFEKARTCCQNVLDMDVKVYGTLPHPQRGRALSAMSICHVTLGNYQEALKLQRKALVAFQPFYEETHPYVAAGYLNLGVCLYSLGIYTEALEIFQKASLLYKEIFKSSFLYHEISRAENSPGFATSLSHTANALAANGRFEAALHSQEEALGIRRTLFGNRHPAVANSLHNMGMYLLSLERHEDALNCFEQALVIYRKIHDKNHPDVLLTLTYIEFCFQGLGQKLSKRQFRQLLDHAMHYLETMSDVRVEKNPSGFVRIRIPVPEDFYLLDQIETLRIHYWPPSIQIDTIEALHNHPRYFESMILHAGYTHAVYQKSQNLALAATHRVYRIIKTPNDEIGVRNPDKRDIFCLGPVCLEMLKVERPPEGSIITFPKDLVHQVVKYEPGTLTMNVVFKGENPVSFFDVFMPEERHVDPQRERDYMKGAESVKIIDDIRKLLKKWEQSAKRSDRDDALFDLGEEEAAYSTEDVIKKKIEAFKKKIQEEWPPERMRVLFGEDKGETSDLVKRNTQALEAVKK